jgi:hypothetical protein
MTFDLAKILEGKRKFRRQLGARPIAEKLALLDALRERELALRRACTKSFFHHIFSNNSDRESENHETKPPDFSR